MCAHHRRSFARKDERIARIASHATSRTTRGLALRAFRQDDPPFRGFFRRRNLHEDARGARRDGFVRRRDLKRGGARRGGVRAASGGRHRGGCG